MRPTKQIVFKVLKVCKPKVILYSIWKK